MGGGRPRGRGNDFDSQIQEAKKKRHEEEQKRNREKQREEGTVPETSSEASGDAMFQEVLTAASPADICGEFYWFQKNLPPNMFQQDKDELVQEVKDRMGVRKAREALAKNPDMEPHILGKRFQILDALSISLGKSLQHILTPPTQTCLLCGKTLTRNHKPTLAALHTLDGKERLSSKNQVNQYFSMDGFRKGRMEA